MVIHSNGETNIALNRVFSAKLKACLTHLTDVDIQLRPKKTTFKYFNLKVHPEFVRACLNRWIKRHTSVFHSDHATYMQSLPH